MGSASNELVIYYRCHKCSFIKSRGKKFSLSIKMKFNIFKPGENKSTAQDPVCLMKVKIDDAALWRKYNGKKYYFCSRNCLEEFKKSPQQFL